MPPYQLLVVNDSRKYTYFAFSQGDTLLAIGHEENRYNAVTSLLGSCRYNQCPSYSVDVDLTDDNCFMQIPTDAEELEECAAVPQIKKTSVTMPTSAAATS